MHVQSNGAWPGWLAEWLARWLPPPPPSPPPGWRSSKRANQFKSQSTWALARVDIIVTKPCKVHD